jgi:hypothetical protein
MSFVVAEDGKVGGGAVRESGKASEKLKAKGKDGLTVREARKQAEAKREKRGRGWRANSGTARIAFYFWRAGKEVFLGKRQRVKQRTRK